MADIELVIKIDEELYNNMKSLPFTTFAEDIIINGILLPKGHGRLIDADKCIRHAWNDFYKHEDEWEKKDKDYLPFGRFYDQNGFECCLKTICKSPTIIEADKVESEE